MRKWLMATTVAAGMACLAAAPAGNPNKPADNAINRPVFPKDNPWNQDISKEPVDPKSDVHIRSIGLNVGLHPDFGPGHIGIPYMIVDKTTPRQTIKSFEYGDESDKGPYPIPDNPLIEGEPGAKDGDRHILCIDRDTWTLYELWNCEKRADGWHAGSGAIFDLTKHPSRPKGWTSADAAGLPIFPGLVRFDEVRLKKEIPHAVRFTCVKTRRAYVPPATHFASRSNDPNLPPMGMRVRLKANYDISRFPPDVQVILTCLKKYGMVLADNGSNWFISGAPDDRWDPEALHAIKQVKGKDFEVVKMGEMTVR